MKRWLIFFILLSVIVAANSAAKIDLSLELWGVGVTVGGPPEVGDTWQGDAMTWQGEAASW